jgi:hypothetical protein
MDHILEYEMLTEALDWRQNGWVLIKGVPQNDGKSYIFAAQIKEIQNLARTKVDGTPGIPVWMCTLYPKFYGIGLKSGKLAAKELSAVSDVYMQKWIGLNNYRVGLNHHKTIGWRETIKDTSLASVLSKQEWIAKTDWAKFPELQ